jgi:hypothetical protein
MGWNSVVRPHSKINDNEVNGLTCLRAPFEPLGCGPQDSMRQNKMEYGADDTMQYRHHGSTYPILRSRNRLFSAACTPTRRRRHTIPQATISTHRGIRFQWDKARCQQLKPLCWAVWPPVVLPRSACKSRRTTTCCHSTTHLLKQHPMPSLNIIQLV